LFGKLYARTNISKSTEPRCAADWHHPGIPSPQVLPERVQPLLVRSAVANEGGANLQVHAQRAGRRGRRHLVRKKTDAGKTQPPGVKRSSERMMGSHRAEGCDALAVFLPRAVQDVFQFPDLVSAVDVACQVVQLHRQPVPAPRDIKWVLPYRC